MIDFSLSSGDMEVLSSFDRNWRCCVPKIKVNGEDVPRDKAHILSIPLMSLFNWCNIVTICRRIIAIVHVL